MRVTKWAKKRKMIMLESDEEQPKWHFLTDAAYSFGKSNGIEKGTEVVIQTDGEEDGLPIISNIKKANQEGSSTSSDSIKKVSYSDNNDFNKQNVLKSIGAILNIEVIDEDLGDKICDLYDKLYNHIYGE